MVKLSKILILFILLIITQYSLQICNEYCKECDKEIEDKCLECKEDKGYKLSNEDKCVPLNKQPFTVVLLAILIPLGILLCGLIYCCIKKSKQKKIVEKRAEAIQRYAGVNLKLESYKKNEVLREKKVIVQPQPLPFVD